jgi:GNAT superfamily N-acetyltransferase
MYDVQLLRVIDLPASTIADCKHLSYGDEGYMCEDLDAAIAKDRAARRRYRYTRACLVFSNGKLVGWSLIEPVPRSPRYVIQMFVDPIYRRKGIGRYLLQQANYISKRKPLVYLDDDNEGFFHKYPDLYAEV